ncbi:hypothetical protein ACQP00_42610 [Dactylosporangium sp. CS-047395]|uniref:hypothetical protein n=1 Tax=Dactylosporangium sp. CS-047395 TaxID=3239936 RepID=UPI003D9408BA
MTRHPDWCAQGHRCGLGEHRAEPIVINVPALGRVVLTRVLGTNGRQHAEVRLRLALADAEPAARRQLRGLAHDLTTVIERAAR